ncbi:hypothetical protein [Neisseria sp.]|uniref:hypothetical protein n=1 Tax=Neisseria sp. TaxID=192066 RepID=UPI0035A01FF7
MQSGIFVKQALVNVKAGFPEREGGIRKVAASFLAGFPDSAAQQKRLRRAVFFMKSVKP